MRAKILFSVLAILFLGGCASTKMVVAESQQLAGPDADTARVIFMRHSFVGSAIQASIFDVTSGEPEFIGISSNETKLAHDVAPGEHVFMVVSEAADFLEANLAGGRTYYAMVTPRMGAWKARFSLYPVRASAGEFQHTSAEFQGWLEDSQFVRNTPESEAWFNENKDSVRRKQDKYWVAWKQKAAGDIAERTLNPDDGV